jgi:hypothetical protein
MPQLEAQTNLFVLQSRGLRDVGVSFMISIIVCMSNMSMVAHTNLPHLPLIPIHSQRKRQGLTVESCVEYIPIF